MSILINSQKMFDKVWILSANDVQNSYWANLLIISYKCVYNIWVFFPGQRGSLCRSQKVLWSWVHSMHALHRIRWVHGLGFGCCRNSILHRNGTQRHWYLRIPPAPGADHSNGRGDLGVPQVRRTTNHRGVRSKKLNGLKPEDFNTTDLMYNS